jgi:cellulose synthase (UDP-forming)
MGEMIAWGPLLFVSGLFLLITAWFGRTAKLTRVLLCATAAAFLLRYLFWRLSYTLPLGESRIQSAWAILFVVSEAGVVLNSLTSLFFLARHRDRTEEVVRYGNSKLLDAPVDVFIATYNEGLDILERTIEGALSIDHDDLRVWVLDDGARDSVRQLSEKLGAHYVFRKKGKHAKAGNVNNGLEQALKVGRRPEFILLLDADFIPKRQILKRVLGFFETPEVGIVQTPQHFYNTDPLQRNLLCSSLWPDEQRFFFNVYMPSKDAWGAAFCCGTSAVVRVDALEKSGGFATDTVTEDMLTTFKMYECGYRTIYLNEALSHGLAPETLAEYVSQRSRWCLGTLQQIYTRWSFSGPARIGWLNRLSHLDSCLYWIARAPFNLLLFCAPIAYWTFGLITIRSTPSELLYWMVPAVVANYAFMTLVSNKRVLPLLTDVSQLLPAVTIVRTVLTTLLRPFGRPFKVTAKGISTSKTTVEWQFFSVFAVLTVLTCFGLCTHISGFNTIRASTGYTLNVLVSLSNVVMLSLAMAACVERPRWRQDERFRSNKRAVVELSSGQTFQAHVHDISVGGARITGIETPSSLSGDGELYLPEANLVLPFSVMNQRTGSLSVRFRLTDKLRRALIIHLFTGDYHNDIEQVRVRRVFAAVTKAIFG